MRSATSPDGAVHQLRATVGDLEIVSNSLGAMKRILAAIKGKRPRLADERDFAYLLARDADVRADALGFMGIVSSVRSSGRGRRCSRRVVRSRSPS